MRFLEEREALLAVVKKMTASQMIIGTWGNASIRIPSQDMMIITPSAMDYEKMTAGDLALISLEGELLEAVYQPSSEWKLHLNIYNRRTDAQAVVHVHSVYASAFAAAHLTIPVALEETAQLIGHEIKVSPYAECGSAELAETVSKELGTDKNAVLMANHGLICLGADIAQAWKAAQVVEKNAQIVFIAKQLGEVHCLSQEEVRKLYWQFK
ncbi:MAG: class II aldolase/adducin family protein, partial [Syntrophomonadaceae bacterium]|nr:class II aldolase/adducin family protein [Syntrophomonadaceae bacterium]